MSSNGETNTPEHAHMHVPPLNTHAGMHTHTLYWRPISVAQMETVQCRDRDETLCCRVNLALLWDLGSPNHHYCRERCAFIQRFNSLSRHNTTVFESVYSALISQRSLGRFCLYCVFPCCTGIISTPLTRLALLHLYCGPSLSRFPR